MRDGRSPLSDEVESLVWRVGLDFSNVQYLGVVASGTQRQLLQSVLGSVCVREREERETKLMYTMFFQLHIDSDLQVAHKYANTEPK